MIHRWIREYGGHFVDVFSAGERAEAVASKLVAGGMAPARAQREAARQVVCAVLVLEIRAGRAGASEQLVSLCLDDVFRWCRFHGRRGTDAQDLAHDALLRMLDQLPRLRDPDRFRPWLWGVVWRVLQEQGRRSWWRRWVGEVTSHRGGGDLEQEVHSAERVAKVSAVLDRLSAEQRTLLFLAYVEELSRKDIAEMLSLPEGTLNRRLTQARAAFASEAEAAGLDGGTWLARAGEEA